VIFDPGVPRAGPSEHGVPSATRREAAKTIRRIRCSPREENGEAAKRTFLMTYTLM